MVVVAAGAVVVVDTCEASVVVVVVTAVVSAATVVDGVSFKQSVFVEVTLTMEMSTTGAMANTETRCIDERIQRVAKIPATRAKIAKTASVTSLPVVGNTQRSVAIMSAPYRKFNFFRIVQNSQVQIIRIALGMSNQFAIDWENVGQIMLDSTHLN